MIRIMAYLSAHLSISIAISILGVLTIAFSINTKGTIKRDVSYLIDNYGTGRTDCLKGCGPNDRDGTGSYRSITYGHTQVKAYGTGAISTDVPLIEGEGCDKSKIVCMKAAVSEEYDYNFKKKTYSVRQTWPFYGKSIESNKISSKDLLSSPKVNEQSAVQRALNQRVFKIDGLPLNTRDREVSKE